MEAPHSKPDLLKEFAERIVNQNKINWPVSEALLAKEFCESFDLPPFLSSVNIPQFSEKLNIVLIKEEIADDVFGLNFCFPEKRVIVLCNRKERHFIQGHTFLHEIREMLEHEFRLLGFSSFTKEDKEDRADGFADLVFLFPIEKSFPYWLERSAKLDKTWKQIGAAAGLICLQIFAILAICYLSSYPQIEPPRHKRRSNNVT